MDLQIDTTNPQAITCHTEELGFTVLGGMRVDGLDRMRVTLKIEVIHRKHGDYLNNPELAALAVRHNLDLYNDVQVEKLIRKTAERLEVGTLQITKAIADITSQLEYYRLRLIEAQEKDKVQKLKILTEEEKRIHSSKYIFSNPLTQPTFADTRCVEVVYSSDS